MIDWDALVLGPSAAVFGEAVQYRPTSGGAFTLPDGVYDANYSRTDIDADGVAVINSFPVLGVRAAAISPVQGDRLTIVRTGEAYAVADVLPDGHGHILLRLEQADAS